jgi:LuxR family transcriptional regulator, quorum-sensing system regulator LasR
MGALEKTQQAFDLIEEAFRARTLPELDAVMARALARFGITHFSLDQMLDANGAPAHVHHFGRRPEEWGVHYVESQHYLHDRVVRHALTSPVPIQWSKALRRGDLDCDEEQLFGEAREFGLADGLVCPVHHFSDRGVSSVAVHAERTLDLSESDAIAINLLALQYHSFGMKLQAEALAAQKPQLTNRQRECLQWVRAGKSSWAIGEVLGIAEATVNFHIGEACKRLNVQTRQQAVIEAIVKGVITL